MDSEKLFAELLDQIRWELRDEIEESVRKETLDAIVEYFTEDEGWDDESGQYRKDVVEQIRDAYDRNF
jgi:hypothetical protein